MKQSFTKTLVIFFVAFLGMVINAKAQCFKQISGGYNHTVAIKHDGTLWAWGDNSYGQLGDGTNVNKTSPKQIGTDNNWSIVNANFHHTVAIKSDGTLWAWGWNSSGQLGYKFYFDRMTSYHRRMIALYGFKHRIVER